MTRANSATLNPTAIAMPPGSGTGEDRQAVHEMDEVHFLKTFHVMKKPCTVEVREGERSSNRSTAWSQGGGGGVRLGDGPSGRSFDA
jgi:hypothetical protein